MTFPKLLSGLSFGQAACVTIKVTITGFKVSSAFYLSHRHDLLTTLDCCRKCIKEAAEILINCHESDLSLIFVVEVFRIVDEELRTGITGAPDGGARENQVCVGEIAREPAKILFSALGRL